MTKLKTPYDFGRGHPNPNCLPDDEMRQLLASISTLHEKKTLSDSNKDEDDEDDRTRLCLNYGHSAGSDRFLSELRSFLERQTINDETIIKKNNDVKLMNDFFITNGVSHGIDLLCGTLTKPGDIVLVERPTYFLVSEIFKSHGLIIQDLPMKSLHGDIDIDQLISILSKMKKRPRMIYIIPTHHNPTSKTLSIKQRQQLAQIVIQYNILLIADEVYHLLDWRTNNDFQNNNNNNITEKANQSRPTRITTFNHLRKSTKDDSIGCCISVSSFTKIFAPGIRLGWIEAPSNIISSLRRHGYIISQGGVAPFLGNFLMCHALHTRVVDSFLEKLNATYSRRVTLLCQILQQEKRIQLPNGIPLGGYFLWIQFPSQVNTIDFLTYCQTQYDVLYRPGPNCDSFFVARNDDPLEYSCHNTDTILADESFQSFARICFADLDEDDLMEGAKRLLCAFQQYMIEIETNE